MLGVRPSNAFSNFGCALCAIWGSKAAAFFAWCRPVCKTAVLPTGRDLQNAMDLRRAGIHPGYCFVRQSLFLCQLKFRMEGSHARNSLR